MDRFEDIRDEHIRIREQIVSLRRNGSTPMGVEALAERVKRHIRDEERGLLATLATFLPRDTGPLRVMDEDHRRILELVEELRLRPDPDRLPLLETLLTSHWKKEEEVLLPYAASRLAPGADPAPPGSTDR